MIREVFAHCVLILCSFVLVGFAPDPAGAEWSVDVESGAALTGYNNVRIPGNTGTKVSLADELKPDAAGFMRLRLSRALGPRQELSLLIAPLRIHGAGSVARNINFNGVVFPANTRLNSYYRFDSYRLTYRYTLRHSRQLSVGLGLTAKIRDASIRIDDGITVAEKKNTGFVPLINFAVDWRLAEHTGLLLAGDALAAPQGRAEDVLLAVYHRPIARVRLRVGYRVLEGGADNDEVYTFALIHYFGMGITLTL